MRSSFTLSSEGLLDGDIRGELGADDEDVAFLADLRSLPSTLPLALPHALLALGDLSRVVGEASRTRFGMPRLSDGDIERTPEMNLEIIFLIDDFESFAPTSAFLVSDPAVPTALGDSALGFRSSSVPQTLGTWD